MKATPGNHPQFEAEILRHGLALWDRMRGERPGVFDLNYWQGHLLEWAMNDPAFKVDLFRLIDVLPALNTHEEVSQHVDEYLIREGRKLPAVLHAAIWAASGGIGGSIAVRAFKKNVEHMAGQFIAGRDADGALSTIRKMRDKGLAFTADLLGEATVSYAEADQYQQRYLDLIETLSMAAGRWRPNPVLDLDHAGPIPKANISLKVTALAPNLDPVDSEGAVKRLKDRVMPILRAARAANVFVNFDLEQWALHDITYSLFEEVALDSSLRDWPHLGIVIQAYLKDSERDLQRLLRLSHTRGFPITARLVKGAYWDFEFVRSRQHGCPLPVFTQKTETDAQFESLTWRMLENHDRIRPAIGTHNLRSIAHSLASAAALGLPNNAYEFQTLFGMAEPERNALAALGHRVRVYMPLGELLPGMAYLVRRLLENTANSGMLRLTHHEGTDVKSLLAAPQPGKKAEASGATVPGEPSSPFENAALTDFTNPAARSAFGDAVRKMGEDLPHDVPAIIDGIERRSAIPITHQCPNDVSRIATRIHGGSSGLAAEAVEVAFAAWPAWREVPLQDRAKRLDRLADLLERDRIRLAAMQCHEVGKPWAEADADVAEAIDFCRYYARRAVVDLAPRRLGDTPGETNVLSYEGRGPTAVIAPWNFPLAILCGMSAAALVSGNPVIMKPAEQSSAIGYELYRRMCDAGFPENVVQFLPGLGEVVGPALVNHPKLEQIAFTGSLAVGCAIWREAAIVRDGQRHLKHVVCEMGGKNAIIVDRDADLDQAVKGVVTSAFGYAGQKCSACSRVIVVGEVYDRFTPRLVEAGKSLHQTEAADPACELPPVVDREACERLAREIAQAEAGAKTVYRATARAGGCFIGPAIFEVSDVGNRLMQEELFGPVVALFRVSTFAAALDVANSVKFALTGGIYSRLPSHLERARRELRVGNLYINRPITGAMVGRQPFGGFGMSGGGTKAGGPDYLLEFVHPRVVTENTMRQGFTPGVGD